MMPMREFIVRWTADGYCVDFYHMVVAESLDKAKELWNEYVNTHKDIKYSWKKATNAEYYRGGYITWKDNGESDRDEGCYKMENVNAYYGSDHLRD